MTRRLSAVLLMGIGSLACDVGSHAHAANPRPQAATPVYGPVCSNGQYLGDVGLSQQGQTYAARRIFYCPQGATVLQLMFAGSYAGGPTTAPPTEHNLVDPQVIDLSVETYVPPVWDKTVSYAVGDQVGLPRLSGHL